MDDYFANSKYKIQDVDFSDGGMSDESDGTLFSKQQIGESESSMVKFFDSLPKQKLSSGIKTFNKRQILEDLGMGSFSKSFILGLVESDMDLSEDTKDTKTFEDESTAPKD
jgi:hypothetical protein